MIEHFDHTTTTEATHSWDRCDHDMNSASAVDLARSLAEFVIGLRCEPSPGLYASWLSKRDGGVHTEPHADERLAVVIGLGFGRPGRLVPLDHLEGAVAESLWYALVHEFAHEDPVVLALPPGLSPIDHGGDGFVVHRRPGGGGLSFRLWEIKKNTGLSPVGGTVLRAYKQVSDKALEYLARLIDTVREHPDADVVPLIQRSSELWLDGASEAAVGIAVGASTASLPTQSFSTIGTHFPSMTAPNRLRGMLTGIDDFPAFALLVQAELWRGL